MRQYVETVAYKSSQVKFIFSIAE